MQVYLLNSLPDFGYSYYIYYLKTDGKYYGWDAQNNRFYNLSTPNIDDLLGLSFENLQEGDVLSYDSVSQTWINKVINTSTGVNSFNDRQGDVYLLSSDVTDALEYTPEDLANKQNDLTPSFIKYPTVDAVNTGLSSKQDSLGYTPENVLNKQNNLTSSTTNYPTVDAVNAGLLTKEPVITSGTSSEYWRGDKTFQTLDKNAIGLNNVDNTSDANKPISTLQATAIGLKEDSSNKSTSTTDSASTTKFPVWSAIVSYFDISRIKTILGITTLSGTNTGDQNLQQVTDLGASTTTSITANSFVKSGGTSSQILAADGSVITQGNNITITGGVISSVGGTGGGGSSVNYYLNGGTSQGTFGGTTYYEFSKTAVIGTGADFSRGSNGYIASFITDVADPSLLLIPAGNWNLEFFFNSSSNGGSPSFYVELYKYNGTTFTLIASNSATPEGITNGTSIDAYFTALAVPETVLTVNDRLAIRVFVNTSGRTITLHTQNGHLCEVMTTFTSGLTALNGLQAQVQNFATGTTGTDFDIVSSGSTHTFNLPSASATARGVVTTGSQTFAGDKTFTGAISASNLSGTNTGDETITTIKTKLGITTLSGSNTGDQDLSGLVTKTTTINSQALSSNITLTTSDITDSTNKRYVTDTNLSTIGNQSGINTGDETITSIKTKLGITTLSGSNTGDQDLSNLVVKNNDISAATKTKITYDTKGLVTSGVDATTADIADTLNKRYITDAQLIVVSNTSGTNTGDNATNSQYSGLAASKQDVLGFTPENETNKTSTVVGNETSEAYFPTIKGLVDWVNSLFITINATFNWYIKGEASWNIKDLDTNTTFFKVNTNGNVLIGTDVEEPSSILNINSTVKGFLPPRMTAEAKRSISMPATGLMIYQIDEEEGLYINKSEGWVFIT